MGWIWRGRENQLAREIAHHLQQLAAEYERDGYSREEALLMAKRAFGGSEQVKEECRDERRFAWLGGIWQDVVFGLRMMRRTPLLTLATLVSLALGIGANTAIVSLMDVVLWRTLPVPHSEQLRLIHWKGQGFPQDLASSASGAMWAEEGERVADFFSYRAFQQMRQGLKGQASVAAYAHAEEVSVSYAGHALVGHERPVSGSFFGTLEVGPEFGRLLSDADEENNTTPAVVLSHRFWATALDADPNVTGKSLRVNNQLRVIVGVAERRFYGLNPGDDADIYCTLRDGVERERLSDDRYWGVSLLARKRDGMSDAQLRAALMTLFRSSWAAEPKDARLAPRIQLDDGSRGLGFLRKEFQKPLWLLGLLVGSLLAIACTNVVNLLLARAVTREREIAARLALGCSRLRLVRQLLTESALMAVFGAVLSVGVGISTANVLGRFITARETQPITIGLDFRILAVAGAIACVALLLFGVFPSLQAVRSSLWMRSGGIAAGTPLARGWRTGRALVAVQMAMSIVMVIAAVAFTRNLLAFRSADPGFDRRNLVIFGLRPGTSGYTKEKLPAFYADLEQRLASTPGVTGVAMAGVRPMDVGGRWDDVRLSGEKTISNVSINDVTPGYLPLLAGRVLAGRNVTRADIESKAHVAVISQDLARALGKENVLGRVLEFPDGPPGVPPARFQIVGVAPAMAVTSMKDRPYAVWQPIERDRRDITVVLRTALPPRVVLPGIRQTIRKLDRNLPLVDVVTMEEQIAKGLQRERMFAGLCTAFGTLALIMSAVGLYGVISYGTSRKKGEIGVRLTLGAMPLHVFGLVVRDGLRLVAWGGLLAIPLVWAGARYVHATIPEVKPADPRSIALAVAILFAIALAALMLPAFRASRLDPAKTLRAE